MFDCEVKKRLRRPHRPADPRATADRFVINPSRRPRRRTRRLTLYHLRDLKNKFATGGTGHSNGCFRDVTQADAEVRGVFQVSERWMDAWWNLMSELNRGEAVYCSKERRKNGGRFINCVSQGHSRLLGGINRLHECDPRVNSSLGGLWEGRDRENMTTRQTVWNSLFETDEQRIKKPGDLRCRIVPGLFSATCWITTARRKLSVRHFPQCF